MSSDRGVRARESWEYSFCCCFTTRTGVIICTYQGLTLLSVTAICTMLSENNEPNVSVTISEYLIVTLFILLMAVGYLSAFCSAFKYEVLLARIGMYLLACGSIMYLILCIFSAAPNKTLRSTVCVSNRCPDHHWLQRSGWRQQAYNNGEDVSGNVLYAILSFVSSLCILGHYVYTTFTFYAFKVYLEKTRKRPDLS